MSVEVTSAPADNIQSDEDSRSVSVPLDQVETEKKSDHSQSVSMPSDKVQPVQPEKNSDYSGSVSMPLDKVQNDNIEVNVKQTDDANEADVSDETDELFDDPLLDIFQYDLETEQFEWKHYASDSDENNDTLLYDPNKKNWHDDLSTLDGSKIAFNQQSLNTRINNLTNALAKNLSQLCSSTLESSQSSQKPASQKSSSSQSQGLSCNDDKVGEKDSGIGSLASEESRAGANNDKAMLDKEIPQTESDATGQSGLAIFHALPFKDQVKYFTDYLRAATEKKVQAYQPMIKNKLDRQCYNKYYWDEKNKVLLHRVLIKNISKFMYNTV